MQRRKITINYRNQHYTNKNITCVF